MFQDIFQEFFSSVMRLDPSSASAMKSLDNTRHKHVADSLTQTARRLDIRDIDIDYPSAISATA